MLYPDHPQALLRSALASLQQGALHDARALFQQLLAKERSLNAVLWSAICEFQLADYPAAIDLFQQAAALEPQQASHYYNMGLSFHELGRLDAAYEAYTQAIALQDDHAEAFNNRGIVQAAQGHYSSALVDYTTALLLDETFNDARFNRAVAYSEQLLYHKAMAEYHAVLKQAPEHTAARFALGVANLILGNWPLGWHQYEARWDYPELSLKRPKVDAPLWDGLMPLQGKRFLLHWEQGFGDTIQFCRFAPRLEQAGAEVTLVVQPELLHLLGSLDGISHLRTQHDGSAYDYTLPLMSLPSALDLQLSELGCEQAYLQAPANQPGHWIKGSKLQIGIAWRGNPGHHNDHRRSLPLAQLLTALPEGADYVVLHPELNDAEASVVATTSRLHISPHPLHDFADTAGLCANLDLVISVDTSVAHLAGAMGLPLWLLLPYNPDWRWLLQREETPWYPSAHLLRQEAGHGWPELLSRLKAQLITFIESH